ncbi:MAG: hypothetical protein ACLFQ8_01275 [Candidatus Aenigmatarchaeota archaeon]
MSSESGAISLLVVGVVSAVIVGGGLAVAFTVLVTGSTGAGRIGLEQSETINAKLRYDSSRDLVDDAVWLGTREAYSEEDGEPGIDDIEEKIKSYLDSLNGTEMTGDGEDPQQYMSLSVNYLHVEKSLEPVVVDFPVDVNARDFTGWGECGSSMTGSWDDVDQYCQCRGYKEVVQQSENPCYQEDVSSDRRKWEPDDNADNCINSWGDTKSGYAMTKVKCNVEVYDISYSVDLKGNMQKPKVLIKDEYSSSQTIQPSSYSRDNGDEDDEDGCDEDECEVGDECKDSGATWDGNQKMCCEGEVMACESVDESGDGCGDGSDSGDECDQDYKCIKTGATKGEYEWKDCKSVSGMHDRCVCQDDP